MSAAESFTISRLARAAFLPTSTVRYYERVGLLKPVERTSGNYRLYSQASLARLRFIRAAQSVGFTLEDVRSLIGAENVPSPSCSEVQRLLEERLTDIDARLKNLRRIRKMLRSSLQKCRRTHHAGRCQLVEALLG